MSNYREEKRLIDAIAIQNIEIAELLGMINRLTAERDQARSIATLLEAECARCWGPVHAEALAVIHGA